MKKIIAAFAVQLIWCAVVFGQAANAPSPAASAQAAIEILDQHLAALGGRAAFDNIKSIEAEAERQVLGRTITTRRVDDISGKRSYTWQNGGTGVIENGYDGRRAWRRAAFYRGYLETSDAQAKSLARGGINLPGAALYNYQTSGKTFARLADEQIEGASYIVIKSAYPDETGKQTQIKYFFDPQTYLLKRTTSGNAVTQTETFDDYRAIGGVTVAFASTVTNPQVTLTSRITALKINAPVDPTIFEFEPTSVPTPPVAVTPVAENRRETDSPPAESKEIGESLRVEIFESVWQTINDSFYDQNFNGTDWRGVRAEYLPLAKATANSDDFYKLLNRMVGELRLSHFAVLAPENVATLGSSAQSLSGGSIGISVKWVENQLVVAKVRDDSPAARHKIKPGFVLRRIGEKTPAELYADYQRENPGFRLREELARPRAALGKLAGKPETEVRLEFADERDRIVKTALIRQKQSGARQLEFESKKLAKNVGYIRFNLFFGDLLPKFEAALNELRETETLIIDLRGNPGGAGDLAPALANLLSSAPGALGSLKYRYETQKYSYAGSGAQAYQGKIVILIDEGSASTAEVFAGGMQANRRATIVGSTSAGAVLPSLVKLLPSGAALQYVVSDFQTVAGVTLEGRGVAPDVKVSVTRADLLAGRDPVLESALGYVNGQK